LYYRFLFSQVVEHSKKWTSAGTQRKAHFRLPRHKSPYPGSFPHPHPTLDGLVSPPVVPPVKRGLKTHPVSSPDATSWRFLMQRTPQSVEWSCPRLFFRFFPDVKPFGSPLLPFYAFFLFFFHAGFWISFLDLNPTHSFFLGPFRVRFLPTPFFRDGPQEVCVQAHPPWRSRILGLWCLGTVPFFQIFFFFRLPLTPIFWFPPLFIFSW